jgi:lipoic acid synthetase
VLTLDFCDRPQSIGLSAAPEVYNHNLETVPRLYRKVRGRADRRSLDLLDHVKTRRRIDEERPDAGAGETTDELLDVLAICDYAQHADAGRYLPNAETHRWHALC